MHHMTNNTGSSQMSYGQPNHPRQSLVPLFIAALACIIGAILIGQ